MAEEPEHKSRLIRGLRFLIEVPAVIVTFVMMVHVTANAVMRKVFNYPLPDTIEVVQYWYLPFIAFLGFIAAQQRSQHIAADLIFQILPKITKRFVLALMFLLASVTSLGFAWFSWGEAMHAFAIKMSAGVTDVISWPTYFLVPLAFGSLTVQFLLASYRAIWRPEKDDFDGDPGDALVLEQIAAEEGVAK